MNYSKVSIWPREVVHAHNVVDSICRARQLGSLGRDVVKLILDSILLLGNCF